MPKKIICFFIALLTAITVVMPANAFTPSGFEVKAANAVVASYDTGEYIFNKNGDGTANIAALNMVMSALVIAEKCEDLDAYNAEMTLGIKKQFLGTGLAVMNLKIGGKYSVRELLSLALIGTYSDAMYLAAVTVFGDVGSCITAMNEKAAALGMTNTVFTDVNGFDSTQYSTAKEVSVMFRAACENSAIKEIMSTRKYTLSPNDYRETATNNQKQVSFSNSCMIINPATVHYYNKIKAGKTGTTDAAGRCIVTLAEESGVRYICVLLGEPVTKEKDKNGNTVRYDFRDTKALAGWALSSFSYRAVVQKGDIVGEAPCGLSNDTDRISAAAAGDLYATLPVTSDNSTMKFNCKYNKEKFNAPIKAGESMGTAEVLYGGEVIGTVDLVAATDVESSMMLVIKNAFGSVLGSKWFKSLLLVAAAIAAAFILTVIIINVSNKVKRSKKVHKDDY